MEGERSTAEGEIGITPHLAPSLFLAISFPLTFLLIVILMFFNNYLYSTDKAPTNLKTRMTRPTIHYPHPLLLKRLRSHHFLFSYYTDSLLSLSLFLNVVFPLLSLTKGMRVVNRWACHSRLEIRGNLVRAIKVVVEK